jgi:catechol 2,3-dioxygenase-like lactoylglutathione lyase family enzyme
MSSTKAATNITKIGVVVVPVSDQDRALEFYVDKLGLELRTDVPVGENYRWVEVAPAGAETTVAIVPPPPDGGPVGVQTGVVFSSEDLDADHASLRDRGVDVDDEIARMGAPVPDMFWFRDHDGNSLLVVQHTESA